MSKNTDTAERLEAARRELEAAQAAYEAEQERAKEWDPRGGEYWVSGDGEVRTEGFDTPFARFGVERPTRQLAEQARDAMRIHNRALAYVHEHAPSWFGLEPREVFFDTHLNRYVTRMIDPSSAIGTVTGPRHVMQKLADDLNSGRVKL